ncbi:MAG: type II toxin-antitoxin system Phd/YefM family antitoxin [Rhodospirillaceae bacterium]|nr:type II toxin-antitoxin system Phd/YefM family antitoxin [Gemmatimonadota bacterium]MYJ70805.1 type II toxin-antitoxin system Phd/YefM family antitoxin [Rhodospirillaceae bacterium]
MKTIGAAKFKERCLALLDGLDHDGLIITKRGKPVARLIPFDRQHAELIGSLRDKIEVRGDILSTGVEWDADAQS